MRRLLFPRTACSCRSRRGDLEHHSAGKKPASILYAGHGQRVTDSKHAETQNIGAGAAKRLM